MKKFRKGSERRWWNVANDNGEMPLKPSEYLSSVVLKYDGGDCLIWPYARNKKGYAHIGVNKKTILISRIACEEENGPPPFDGAEAAHSCGNGDGGCVARKHLRWATRLENDADKEIHGTVNIGARNGSNKLSESSVIEIYNAKGTATQTRIAKDFGVSRWTVSDIHNGRIWSWLTGANDNRDKVRAA